MGRALNKLSAARVNAATYQGRAYKLADGGGLTLLVDANGKHWRFRYRFAGKERMTSFGSLPDVSLAKARTQRQDARDLLRDGIDPVAHRRAQRAAQAATRTTLESVATEWIAAQTWVSSYREKVKGRLRRHIYPQLGKRPIGEITAPELLDVLRRVEKAGTLQTARLCKQHVARTYRYAIAAGLAAHNPAAGLEEALSARPRPRHFSAITDPDKLGGLLRAIEAFEGTPPVRGALRLAPYLLLRPGELRQMEWSELDLEGALCSIPAGKMKMDRDHLVPLPDQALAILRELEPWYGEGRWVFPGGRSVERPMSENALIAALRRLGYTGDEVTIHGLRATARTLLDEVLHFRPDFIEHQLAHAVRDANGRAYNRTTFLNERREMLQIYADYLDGLRDKKGKELRLRDSDG
ncbi:MAG: integrase arm-type DNA-binding domain-containing protein [Halofilum sp. (in: g-proteobacteria)]